VATRWRPCVGDPPQAPPKDPDVFLSHSAIVTAYACVAAVPIAVISLIGFIVRRRGAMLLLIAGILAGPPAVFGLFLWTQL